MNENSKWLIITKNTSTQENISIIPLSPVLLFFSARLFPLGESKNEIHHINDKKTLFIETAII